MANVDPTGGADPAYQHPANQDYLSQASAEDMEAFNLAMKEAGATTETEASDADRAKIQEEIRKGIIMNMVNENQKNMDRIKEAFED